MIRFALLFFAVVQFIYWRSALFRQEEWPLLDRVGPGLMLLAAVVTFGLELKGSKSKSSDGFQALLQLGVLAVVMVSFWQNAEPQVFMIFAMPMGYLIFGPPVSSIFLLLSRHRN